MGELIYILLGLTSVVGLAFIVERGLMLRWNKVVPREIARSLAACRTRDDVPALRHACERKPSPLGRLLLLAADNLDRPKADNVDALQTAARHEIVRLERGLVVLEIIVGIAPLLGLVGTIAGMMTVFGDVGQTFMYGAKGGSVYVLGNAAGRPLINSVGRPRVIINGTCLDFLAESFMAGDPHNGGGFVILNGVKFDDDGQLVPLPEPYPGSNLFSLASGGAIYVRDPSDKVTVDQLNGGRISKLSDKDWELLMPYLRENENLFGISIQNDLLMKAGNVVRPEEIYKKIEVVPIAAASKVQKEDLADDEAS